jgi:hypothetical protein
MTVQPDRPGGVEWTYYAVFEPPRYSAETPSTVLRQRIDARLRRNAETLTKDGAWRPSELLALIFLGHNETEVEEITHERATQLARRWNSEGKLASIPPDLAVTDPP